MPTCAHLDQVQLTELPESVEDCEECLKVGDPWLHLRICLSCGKVEEFFGEPLQKMRRQMESSLGFKIVTARTEMGGYCPDCQSQLAQESAEKARAGQIG